jgi:hypothetical protein
MAASIRVWSVPAESTVIPPAKRIMAVMLAMRATAWVSSSPQPNATSRQRRRTPRRHSNEPVAAGPALSIRADSRLSHGDARP